MKNEILWLDEATHVIVDQARLPGLTPVLNDMSLTSFSLYSIETYSHLQAVAPVLVPLNPSLRQFLKNEPEALKQVLGMSSPADEFELVRHFEQLTTVTTDRNEVLFFRYFDPRILTRILPTCSPEQLAEFFGPVRFFYTETEDGAAYSKWWMQNGLLKSDIIQPEHLLLQDSTPQAPAAAEVTTRPQSPKKSGDNSWID